MLSHDTLHLAADLPRHEAERLLVAVIGRGRHELALSVEVDDDQVDRFRRLVERRRLGIPLQHLEGTVAFGPLELLSDGRALIPRPETEQLWDLLVRTVRPAPQVVVDLCTGSGNLALAFAHAWPDARVLATDLSTSALALARENAQHTALDVAFFEGDLFGPLPAALKGRVDLVVSNPPYLADDELAGIPAEVRDHEPHMALTSGPTGLEVLARIAAEAGEWLRPGGIVACEISEFHPARVEALFATLSGRVRDDLTGRPRFVIGRSPEAVEG